MIELTLQWEEREEEAYDILIKSTDVYKTQCYDKFIDVCFNFEITYYILRMCLHIKHSNTHQTLCGI